MLVNYTSDKGDKLQARDLPAGRVREGQVVSDDGEFLRADVADREPLRKPKRERLQSFGLHEQRLRRVRAGHCLQGERPWHVGRVVHGARRQGGDRDRHRRSRSRSESRATRGAATRRRSW